MGEILCCGGALKELRRISSGPFSISSSVTLERLEDAALRGTHETLTVSPYAALSHMPDIPLNDSGLALVRHGRSPEWHDTGVPVPTALDDGTLVRLTRNGALAAVAECRLYGDDPPRIILKRVFM